jgi:hypothetical protein
LTQDVGDRRLDVVAMTRLRGAPVRGAPALKGQLFSGRNSIRQLINFLPRDPVFLSAFVKVFLVLLDNPAALFIRLFLHWVIVPKIRALSVDPDRCVIGRHRRRSLSKRSNDYCIHGTHLIRANRINSSLMVLREGIDPPCSPI